MSERELVQDSAGTAGQIFANYQAALHLLEEAVGGGNGATAPPAFEALRSAAHDVFEPVLEACTVVAPGLEELVADACEAGEPSRAGTPRDLVSAERQRIAVFHSRLIRRRPALVRFAEARAASDGAYGITLAAAASRLDELEAGSHSAGALFRLLADRWYARAPT